MPQLAREHPGHDLHVVVRVRPEAPTRRDDVLVEDAQRSEVHPGRVEVAGEGEGVRGLQPAVVRVAALGRATDRESLGGAHEYFIGR